MSEWLSLNVSKVHGPSDQNLTDLLQRLGLTTNLKQREFLDKPISRIVNYIENFVFKLTYNDCKLHFIIILCKKKKILFIVLVIARIHYCCSQRIF